MAPPSVPSNRVLPTLNNDGTRRWVRPKLYQGRFYYRRLFVAWALIVTFATLPFIEVGGHPALLLDIPNRKFHWFGSTFLATDGVLLMLLLLSIFVGIFWLTALFGRVWCGWGCPQTVYMEFVFRPIEQLLEGSRGQQLRMDREGPTPRRILKWVIYAILSLLLANVFLSYFVGVDALQRWMLSPPSEHPVGFAVVMGVAGLVFFDFAYFREQMCTVACPYARLQSVLLDQSSLVIGYDASRGEPRGQGRKRGGDCIDCNACVITCPMGIDIRNGLQLECVACTQCIDACDSVMDKLNKPRGLIRYASDEWFQSQRAPRWLRPRVVIYPLLLVALLAGLFVASRGREAAEVTILRAVDNPYAHIDHQIQNRLRIKIQNRASEDAQYTISLLDADDAQLIAPENPLRVAAGEQATTTVFVLSAPELFNDGLRNIQVLIDDGAGFEKRITYKLMGPQ